MRNIGSVLKTAFSFVFIIAVFPLVAAGAEFDADRFEEIVIDGMEIWHVPGMAVTVVEEGEVVFLQGFGVTTTDNGSAVDEHTLFANASTTKAMVVAGLLMLADEGKLDLDDLVIKHIPELHFGEASLTQLLTIRDLLAHRSGLPSTDFWTFGQNIPIEDQLALLRFVEPVTAPRTRLIYQNTMYEIAGLIIKRISGQRWDEFLTERLWQPIGMHETYGSRDAMGADREHVQPHDYLGGAVKQLRMDLPGDLADAAGSAWTSIYDMSRWAQFLLRNGVTEDGKRLISAEGMDEMFEPQQLAAPADFYPTVALTRPHWRTYALGWFQQDFQGRAIDFHTGSLNGLIAIIGLDREAGKAVVVLGNRDHAEMRHALLWEVMDNDAPADKRDWNAEVFELYAAAELKTLEGWQEMEAARIPDSKMRLPLDAYAGEYLSDVYGGVTITVHDDGLRADIALLSVALSHWHQDAFLVTHEDWRYGFLTSFDFDASGRIHSVDLFGQTFVRSD